MGIRTQGFALMWQPTSALFDFKADNFLKKILSVSYLNLVTQGLAG